MESTKENFSEELMGRTGIKTQMADVGIGLKDMGMEKGKLGQSERLGLTYIHYQM